MSAFAVVHRPAATAKLGWKAECLLSQQSCLFIWPIRTTSTLFKSGLMGQPNFKPFELPSVVRIKAHCAAQPIPVGRKVATIEGIHSKVLSGVLIASLVRSIIQASPAESIRNSAFGGKAIGQRNHGRKVSA